MNKYFMATPTMAKLEMATINNELKKMVKLIVSKINMAKLTILWLFDQCDI